MPLPMIRYFARTPYGQVDILTARETRESSDPVLLFLHGAFRRIEDVAPLAERFENIAYGYLPGHHAPELDTPTLETWIEAFSRATGLFKGPVIAIGESLGGVLAMGMRRTAAVVAFDPFLRTSHLWPLEDVFVRAEQRDYPLGARMILRSPGFRHILPGRSGPLEILAGDQPLMPRRLTETAPSLLDDEDEAILRRHGVVTRVKGGHSLINENLEACEEAVRRSLASVRAAAKSPAASAG